MKTRIMPLLAIAALVMPAAALSAETPKRGLTESQVRSQFGAPNSTRGPVGSPAITRWNYPGFTVYFENGISLHTVVDRPVQQAPAVVSGTDDLPPIEEVRAAEPAPTSAAPAEAPPPAPEAQGEMSFDPVSGRFMPAGEAAAADQPSEPAPEPAVEEAVEPAPATEAAAEAPVAAPASEPETATVSEPEPMPEPEPEPEPVPEPAPVPAPAPAPAAAPEPAPAPATDSEFRFDPVTGRIIIAGEETPEQAAAQSQADAAIAEAKKEAVKASAEEAAADSESAAKEAAEKVEEAADDAADTATEAASDAAEEAEEGGGFYIDWGASQ